MNILKKYKKNKIYGILMMLSTLITLLIFIVLLGREVNDSLKYLNVRTSEFKLKLLVEDLLIVEETLKNNPNLSIEELVFDYKEAIKTKNELSEEIKNTRKELEESSNSQYLLLKFNILMILICLWSTYMCIKTKTTKENYIELLKENKNYQEEALKYLDTYTINELLSEINFLKEFQKLVTEKDWLLKRIKESKNFKDLLNCNNFQEYLLLFEKDYINDYFKDEILEIQENNQKINNIIKENIVNEKEIFKIIKM